MVATYIPGFTPELQNGLGRMHMLPDSFYGGPAYADMSMFPAQPDTVSPMAQPAPQARGFGSQILNNALASQTPAQPAAAQPAGLTFLTDRGRQAGYGKGSSGFVAFDPNAQYRMWDERGKNRIVSSGTGQSGLEAIHALANQFNTEQGRKANYGIERLNPATGRWERILENDPRKNVVGKIADIALPIAASFIPGVGPVLGAAIGSGVSSVAQGRSLKDTLMRAGLTAATAGIMDKTGLSSAIGGALSGGGGAAGSAAGSTLGSGVSGLGSAVSGALGSAIGQAGNQIIVNGVSSGIGGAIGSAIGAGAGGALGSVVGGLTPGLDSAMPNEIVVTNAPQPAPPVPVGPAVGSALGSVAPSNGIVVTAPPQPAPGVPVGPAVGGALGSAVAPNEIVVTAPPRQTNLENEPALPLNQIPTNTPVQQPAVQNPQQGNTLDEIVKYLRAAGLLTGLVGGAVGGGQQGNGVIPGGFGGGLPSGFGGGLPAPTMPGASNNFVQRPANMDWKRYGYGPGQSFFDYVPQGEANTSQAYTGYAEGGEVQGYGAGGEMLGGDSFAVQGPGTGREDKIPALLSDGEYVIDAETVALLGDGSSEAGANKLDAFRVNVRKHKGQQLARGNFSPDARDPMHYLQGGRT